MKIVQEVLVRDWDSQNLRLISIKEFEQAEDKSGKQSAFAWSRAVYSGIVDGTGMTVTEYLEYRNK